MLITAWTGTDLPRDLLRPPHLTMSYDAQYYRFSPVTVAVSGVDAGTSWLEWEVHPADEDDFPEAYRDKTDAATTSRVLYLRPGYSYDIRVREISDTGAAGAWAEATQLTVTGTKVSPGAANLPTTSFPDIDPDWVIERRQDEPGHIHESDHGRQAAVGRWPRPRNRWRLSFTNRTAEDLQSLIDFHDRMAAQTTPFTWTHPTTGNSYAVRFGNDAAEPTWGEVSPDDQLGDLELELVEVVYGISTTLTLSLELDEDYVDPPAIPPTPVPDPQLPVDADASCAAAEHREIFLSLIAYGDFPTYLYQGVLKNLRLINCTWADDSHKAVITATETEWELSIEESTYTVVATASRSGEAEPPTSGWTIDENDTGLSLNDDSLEWQYV
jgi:hypothetical protein